jgi:hypothetical protein
MKEVGMSKTLKIVVIVLAVAIILVAAQHVPSFGSLMRKIHGG